MLLRKRSIGSLLLCLVFLVGPLLYILGVQSPKLNPTVWIIDALVPRPINVIPPTTHVVLFKFKESATPIQIKDLTSKMLALKKQCTHPGTNTQYIKSITGGKDNSQEGLQNGITHAFIMHFHSKEDRDYYVNDDPVHQAFKETAAPYLEKAIVVDFQEGIFTRTDAMP